MAEYLTPGVYIEERPAPRPIEAVGTSTAAFLGAAPSAKARRNEAVQISSWSKFVDEFVSEGSESTPLANAVFGFFQNGGGLCYVVNTGGGESISEKQVAVLEAYDDVAIVAAPGCHDLASHVAVLSHCENLKDRFAILDSPPEVGELKQLTEVAQASGKSKKGDDAATAAGGGVRPPSSDGGFGAYYFPWIHIRDPISGKSSTAPPSGHLAGIYARTDATRGVHKAPANETVRGALGLTRLVTHNEQKDLNRNGVNCLRFFAREGIRVWGARTLADSSSEWRYVNVRRLFNMIEESIGSSTRWIVFEPNDMSLWKSIRRDVTAFLTLLWRQGALMGASPEEAFFVQCDSETNPPEVVDAGQVITVIGIAPVKPAEFVIFRIGQGAEGTEVEVLSS